MRALRAARIAVDAGRTLGQVSPGVRGFNFWGTRSDDAFLPEYRTIGLKLLRFPPGRTGDENDLDRSLIDDSARVARGVQGDLVTLVRLRGGSPATAANNVGYMNVQKRYAARYWEVGNEPDIYGRRPGEPEFTPAWYSEQFRAFAAAMKAIDPSITIFGPVLSHKLDEWMPPFIAACGDVIDGLSWHFYGGGGDTPEDELLASTQRFDEQVRKVRAWWGDRALNPRGAARSIPLLISEYGASYDTRRPRNLVTQAAAVWTADMLGHLVMNRIDLAAYFTLWGIDYHGVWDRRGTPRPVYQIFRIFSEFGSRLLHAEADAPLLAAYAAQRDDGALSLMVVNKDPAATFEAAVELASFAPEGAGTLWRHVEGQPAVAQPYAAAGPLRLELPPYSTSMLVLPGRVLPAIGPAALVGGGVAVAATAAALAFLRRRARRARRV